MLLDRADPQGFVLKALREAGNSLISEMYGVDEELLDVSPADGEMCLKEIAAHVRDAEELALRQMATIAEGSRRALPAWDVDMLPMEREYRLQDLETFLSEFRGLRQETTAFLWTAGDYAWESVGRHPYRGEVTLGQIASELAQHDLEHLWQVRRLKVELGAGRLTGREIRMTERQKTWARPVVFFEIHAQDQEKAAAFYREMFEWNIAPGNIPGFLSIEHGIGAPPEGLSGIIAPATHGATVSIVIQVSDLRDSLVQAEELGGKVLMQPIDVPQGPTVARIADPEGNVLTLVQQ